MLTVIAAGLGPYEEPWLRGLLDGRTRRYYRLIRRAEPLFRAMFALGFSDDLDTLARKTAAVDPSTPDGRFYRQDPDATRELLAGNVAAARQGMRWPVQDLRVPLLPWGFGLGDVAGRVSWWHGIADRNVPFAAGEATAKRLPNCEFHPVVDAGHVVPLDHATQLLTIVRESMA